MKIIELTTILSATNLSDPLMEVNRMLTVYSFSVQRELKSTVLEQPSKSLDWTSRHTKVERLKCWSDD